MKRDRAMERMGLTLMEVLIGLAIIGFILVDVYRMMTHSGRIELRASAAYSSVMSAEIAMGHLLSDLRSMAPPDPGSGVAPYTIAPDGLSLSFQRLEESGGSLVSRHVRYEARSTENRLGNYHLFRDGERLGTVLLGAFEVREIKSAGSDRDATNPVLEIKLTGIHGDVSHEGLKNTDLHELRASFPVPDTAPAATIGLPAQAQELLKGAVRHEGPPPGP